MPLLSKICSLLSTEEHNGISTEEGDHVYVQYDKIHRPQQGHGGELNVPGQIRRDLEVHDLRFHNLFNQHACLQLLALHKDVVLSHGEILVVCVPLLPVLHFNVPANLRNSMIKASQSTVLLSQDVDCIIEGVGALLVCINLVGTNSSGLLVATIGPLVDLD